MRKSLTKKISGLERNPRFLVNYWIYWNDLIHQSNWIIKIKENLYSNNEWMSVTMGTCLLLLLLFSFSHWKKIYVWDRKNSPLHISSISRSNCDIDSWVFFSKDSPHNSLQNLMKRIVRTINCGLVSGQHCNASKWHSFNTLIFILTILRRSLDSI